MKKVIIVLSALFLLLLSANMNICVMAEETDASFQREADIISKLDIYNAEDENKLITFGEMVSALVNISGVDLGMAEKLYYDVELSDPIAKNITAAYHLGIISVPEGARLMPERTVSYDETVKMAARILGYGKLVDENYAAVISRIKFTKHISISDYSALTQGNAVQILYKMLDEEVVECSQKRELAGTGKTVLESYLHIERITGIVDSTSISSLTGSATVGKNKIAIDGKSYPAPAVQNVEEYLGCRVEGYLKENDKEQTEFLYFGKYKNEIITINDNDIENVTPSTIEYYCNGKTLQARLSGTEDIIFNNVASPTFDINLLYIDKFDGYIELINNDNNDDFEVFKVYSYKNYTLKAYDGKYRFTTEENKGVLDFSDYKNIVFQKPDGSAPVLEDYAVNTLISVFDSGNREYVKIIVNSKNTVGYVSFMDTKNNTIIIDGIDYHTDSEFFSTYDSKLKNGKITVLLDFMNKVGAISTDESEFGLKWGYLCDIIREKGLEGTIKVKIFNTDGTMGVYELYKKVYLDGENKADDKVYEFFSAIDASNGKQYCKRQFIKYALNSNGLVTDIDSPVRTEYENDECNNAVTVEDKFTITDDLSFFSKANYAIAKDVKIFVIPVDSSGRESENRNFSDSDYCMLSAARTFVPFSNFTLKLELADIDESNISSLVAVEEVHYSEPAPGGPTIEKYNKMREYMVEGFGFGLDENEDVCPMLRYYSQRDNNRVLTALADSSDVFMKPVYDENGKVVTGEYRPLKRGDIIRIKFDYSGKKIVAVAVDFDIDRTDNGRFKTNQFFTIGIAKVKTGVGLRIAYKTLQDAPSFDGHNADEVFDLSVGSNSKISGILANGYITVYDREDDKIYMGGYNDLLDYNSSPDNLPIIINRWRYSNELAIFVIK